MSEEKVIQAEVVPVLKPAKPRDYTKKSLDSQEFRTLKHFANAVKNGEKTSLRQSAIAAGYSESYASVAARKIGEIVSQNETIVAWMEAQGVGLKSIVDDLAELRKATKFIKDDKGFMEVPDNDIRQRNVEFRAKILNAVPHPKIEVDERRININITADTVEKIIAVKGALPE